MGDNPQQAIQAMQAQIQALQAQIQQDAQPGPFALSPALANQGVIDYTTSMGAKIRKAAIEPLDVPFDGKSANLQTFLKQVQDRARDSGWNDILTISDQAAENPQNRNLITQHRMLTIENVRAAAAAYIGHPVRNAQNSDMLYQFLDKSLSKEMRKTMMTERSKYEITANDVTYNDGPSFLKALLMKSQVETNATNFYLRETLQRLPEKISDMDDNIEDFNDYVSMQVTNLSAGGQTSTDLLVSLFLAYQRVKDRDFNDYIKRKKEQYDEGDTFTPQELMDAALTKYNTLNQAKTWKVPSEEAQQIVALTAQLEQYKKQLAKRQKSNSKSSDIDDKSDKQNKSQRKAKEYPAWRKQKPRPNQKSRKVDGTTYLWCDHHGLWMSHSTEDCRAKKRAEEKAKNKSKTKKDNNKDSSVLTIAKGLAAIVEGENEDDDSSLHDE